MLYIAIDSSPNFSDQTVATIFVEFVLKPGAWQFEAPMIIATLLKLKYE